MAFYLWMRFDVNNEEWPQWPNGEKWQSIKLFKANKGQFEGLTYDAQLKYVKRTFEDRGIFMKSWTHAGRHAGVLQGEALSIPDAELRRLGHWDSSRMAKHYSSGVSREAAREMAGHKKGDGSYYLTRECLLPPTELQKQVFPRLEESLDYINSFDVKERDTAAQAFLATLQWFRVVLLQDAVILGDMFPRSPLWQKPLFQSPEFSDFKQLALQKMEEDPHPHNVQLQKTIPIVADRLLIMSQIAADGFRNLEKIIQVDRDIGRSLQRQVETLLSKASDAEKYLSRLSRGAQGFVDAYNDGGVPQIPPSPTNLVPSRPECQSDDSHDANTVRVYIPNANIHSVEEVYEEWYHGLVDGPNGKRGPAMKELEERCGTSWRKEEYIRKRFQRRGIIIRRLNTTAKRLGISNRDAARRTELWRLQKKMILDKLQKHITANDELWGHNDLELRMLN